MNAEKHGLNPRFLSVLSVALKFASSPQISAQVFLKALPLSSLTVNPRIDR
jgi:hypothetical protein